MKKLIGFTFLTGLSAFVHADGEYSIDAKIYNNTHLVTSPSFIVSSNKEVSISVGGNSYAFTVSPLDNATVKLATSLNINGENITPTMHIELGKEASVSIGAKEMSVVVNKTSS